MKTKHPMQRVLVIGCPGAGKSTFARWLREKTALPLYYLDQLWHNPDRTTRSREAFDADLAAILAEERWIIDGNYSRTLERRIAACDTVFLLDLPTAVCLAGAAARVGQPREDMPWTEDVFDPEFRDYIAAFADEQSPKIYELLKRYKNKRIVTFCSREDIEQYKKSFRIL